MDSLPNPGGTRVQRDKYLDGLIVRMTTVKSSLLMLAGRRVIDAKAARQRLEVDFLANLGYRRYHIQSALNLDTDEKREQERRSLCLVSDSFKKIVNVNKAMKSYADDEGILTMGLLDYLLNHDSLDYVWRAETNSRDIP